MGKKKEEIRVKLNEPEEAYQKKAAKESFPLPSLEDRIVDLNVFTPEMAAIKAEELREKEVPKLVEEVKRVLTWLDSLAKVGREEREVVEFDIKDSGKKHPNQWLQENLSHEFPPYRRATWVTLLSYYFSKEVKSPQEVQELLNSLCHQGYLVENPEGPFKAYQKAYALPEKAAEVLTDEPELPQLIRALNELLWQAKEATRKMAEEKSKALLSQGELTWKKFLGGKPGLFALAVPPRRDLRGGTLLVKSDGERVFPLEAVGGFQNAVEEAKELRVFLLLRSLSRNTPPFVKGVTSEIGSKISLLWHLLKEGILELMKEEEAQALREEMKAAANLTPEEFFLEKKSGIAFAEYKGAWIWKTTVGKEAKKTRLKNLFFLVERQERDGQPVVRLVRIPPWLEEFFSDCQEEFKEGEEFREVPQPLQATLRAIWGQVRRGFQVANHTA